MKHCGAGRLVASKRRAGCSRL